MTLEITSDVVNKFKSKLENHPIYETIETIEDLQCFMEHHIYSVWDFMSLIKYLQSIIAPVEYPWFPKGDGNIRRFINELVLEEESDETNISGQYLSHFELYQSAMKEIGADTVPSSYFFDSVRNNGIKKAFISKNIPLPSNTFTSSTFHLIENNKPHEVAAALALGREHIIPCMFRSILKKLGVSEKEAPTFHFYLNRHIGLDEDFHAPLSLKLLNSLCKNNQANINEAITTANSVITARLKFWDGVLEAMKLQRIS